jgi:hypothetical protein
MSNGELREVPKAARPPEQRRETEPNREQPRPVEAKPAAAAEKPAFENIQQAQPALQAAVSKQPKDPQLMRVERILEENLGDVYFSLPAELRPKFKLKGEETATKIHGLIEQAKAKARTVLDLIRAWLKMIPGVNAYFLEQEAKIKTDRLMTLAEDRKKEKETQI